MRKPPSSELNYYRIIHHFEPLWGTEQKIMFEFVRKYVDVNTDDERHPLIRPADVVVDEEGSVFILDGGSHLVKKFGRDGNYLSSFGGKGIGPGKFMGAAQMKMRPNGDIVINDLAMRVCLQRKYLPFVQVKLLCFIEESSVRKTFCQTIFKFFGPFSRQNNLWLQFRERKIRKAQIQIRTGVHLKNILK